MYKVFLYVQALAAFTIAVIFTGEAAGRYSGTWLGFFSAMAALLWWLIAARIFTHSFSDKEVRKD